MRPIRPRAQLRHSEFATDLFDPPRGASAATPDTRCAWGAPPRPTPLSTLPLTARRIAPARRRRLGAAFFPVTRILPRASRIQAAPRPAAVAVSRYEDDLDLRDLTAPPTSSRTLLTNSARAPTWAGGPLVERSVRPSSAPASSGPARLPHPRHPAYPMTALPTCWRFRRPGRVGHVGAAETLSVMPHARPPRRGCGGDASEPRTAAVGISPPFGRIHYTSDHRNPRGCIHARERRPPRACRHRPLFGFGPATLTLFHSSPSTSPSGAVGAGFCTAPPVVVPFCSPRSPRSLRPGADEASPCSQTPSCLPQLSARTSRAELG